MILNLNIPGLEPHVVKALTEMIDRAQNGEVELMFRISYVAREGEEPVHTFNLMVADEDLRRFAFMSGSAKAPSRAGVRKP